MYESIIIILIIVLFSLGFYIKTLHSMNRNMQKSLAFWKNEFQLNTEHAKKGIQHDMEC